MLHIVVLLVPFELLQVVVLGSDALVLVFLPVSVGVLIVVVVSVVVLVSELPLPVMLLAFVLLIVVLLVPIMLVPVVVLVSGLLMPVLLLVPMVLLPIVPALSARGCGTLPAPPEAWAKAKGRAGDPGSIMKSRVPVDAGATPPDQKRSHPGPSLPTVGSHVILLLIVAWWVVIWKMFGVRVAPRVCTASGVYESFG